MNSEQFNNGSSLPTIIQDLMAANLRNKDLAPNKYWYPLAVPTYGVSEVLQAIDSMVTYRTTMWEKTRLFEEMFGARFGGEAVMVNSGSSADLLMVFALLTQSGGTLNPGDEVCVPAVTWPTHLWSVLMAGLTPVLVDVDPVTLNIDIEDLKKKITHRTKAIFPVHLMGNPADMDSINAIARTNGLYVIEDCCESLGAKWNNQFVGSNSSGGSFSFFFSHHMCTMEGGMILTRDKELAERFRLLRAHGWSRNLRDVDKVSELINRGYPGLDPRYTFIEWGFNVRPTELQAGFGLEQLTRLDEFEAQRKRNFEDIYKQLSVIFPEFAFPKVHENAEPSWFAVPIMIQKNSRFSRDDLVEYLQRAGVETRPIVAGNLAKQPVKRRFESVFSGSFPGADSIHNNGFYIGLHPFALEGNLSRLVETFVNFEKQLH